MKRKQSIREIADALDRGGLPHASGDFLGTVTTMFGRHAKKDLDLVRVGRGDWGLAASVRESAACRPTNNEW